MAPWRQRIGCHLRPTPNSLRYMSRRLPRKADPKEKFGAPEEVEQWLLTLRQEKLVKIGAGTVRHDRYVTFQMAEVAVPR